ncbi:MAG: Cof-type HAD-IIB family hydrolase [Defluviitaleaceae bacterium]|nr:Cof-type HAD-IIB family hydrolase [Defluviitaleaceae bacterium]
MIKENMNIKQIVLDIDGTLLTSKKEISENTKKALIKAQENGIQIVLASGRPTSGMVTLIKNLQMDKYGGLALSYNGARITDAMTGDVLFDTTLPQVFVTKVLEHLKSFDVIPMVNDDKYMYVNNVYGGMIYTFGKLSNIIEYESRGGNFLLCEKIDLAKFVDFSLNKILIAGEANYLKENIDNIFSPFENELNGAFSTPFYFEITAKNIDKANALHIVNQKNNIDKSNVMSFGDAHNDRSIIEYAKIGVAMGNAHDDMKAIAQYITLSNDEDGIMHALEHFGVI